MDKALSPIFKRSKEPLIQSGNLLMPPEMSQEQQAAVQKILSSRWSILTGGPGTGKTFCAAGVIALFSKLFTEQHGRAPLILLTAPTGKAASHLHAKTEGSSSSKIVFGTLHKILGISEDPFRKTGFHKLAPDLCIVDEASMLDDRLLLRLLGALHEKSHLLLMGDPDQLPPIGSGTPFSDLVTYGKTDPEKIPLVTLHTSHRVEGQPLLQLADAIRTGNSERFFEIAPLYELPKNPEEAFEILHTHLDLSLKQNGPLMLTPLNEGAWGQKQLNLSYTCFLEGKINLCGYKTPIMATRNSYDHGVMNGEIGWRSGEMIYFHEREFHPSSIEHETAFAISMHKSQGSEFNKVALFFPEGSEKFGRQLLYTAITRAKQNLVIFGSQKTLLALLTSL